MSTSRQKRIDKAQMRVLFQTPFFAPGVAKLPIVFDDKIDTACTNGEEIRWNPDWFDKLPDQCLPTVLCHEVCHCMLGHLWRAPGGVNWDVWNQATDHAVNLMLKEFSQLVTSKNLADPFPFPDPQDAYCADPRFAGQSEEQIYAALNAAKPPGGGGQPKPGKVNPSGQGQGQGKGQGKGQPAPGKGSMPSFGQMQQPQPGTASAAKGKKLQNDWDGTLIQAAQMSQGRGDCPAGMRRLVEHLVNPSVPWYEVLRSWIREQCSDDWNFLKPAMEYSDSGFILPSLHSERMGPVVFATDTSGSINNELLAKFQTEKQACLDDMRPAKLVDLYCDTQIHKVAEYVVGDTIATDAPGGGGTDFRPVWKHLEEMPVRPKCVVYLTDLDGTFPADDGGIPTIWVTWTKGGTAPFGEVVHAEL